MPKGKIYLGNNVYAERVDDYIKLSAEEVCEVIYLSPEAYDALICFKADMDEEIEEEINNSLMLEERADYIRELFVNEKVENG